MSIVKVKNVSIRYITGDLKRIGLKKYICDKIRGKFHVKELWANRNINFSLEKGDMLGIIGTNGAGKSTLLKAVSGVMKPETGTIKVHGNIAALLELASGFDGELTLRENAYLRGALLGYTKQFMDENYDAMIDYAELREYEEMNFQQLSSGMKSRLAFAIASMLKPDVLILDEVLSVGDAGFKAKSEATLRNLIQSGVTTLFVSHSVEQVKELCNKVLWLHKGQQKAFSADVEAICDEYLGFVKKK